MGTVVIGDVHGCGMELRDLLRRIDRRVPNARLIFVGDLFNKGPRPEVVVEEILLRRLQRSRIDLVCGNHELKLQAALRWHARGTPIEELPTSCAATIRSLESAGLIRAATEIVDEAVATVQVRGPGNRWTVLHGGILPDRGINRTPDSVKITLKADPDERDWWSEYRGADGLLVVGHKPLAKPLAIRGEDLRPIVVNVDTGCAYGGHLTAYWIEADRFIQVRSQQPRLREFTKLPAVSTCRQWASAGPVRTLAR